MKNISVSGCGTVWVSSNACSFHSNFHDGCSRQCSAIFGTAAKGVTSVLIMPNAIGLARSFLLEPPNSIAQQTGKSNLDNVVPESREFILDLARQIFESRARCPDQSEDELGRSIVSSFSGIG